MDFQWPSFMNQGDAIDEINQQSEKMMQQSQQFAVNSHESFTGLGSSYVPTRPARPHSSASFPTISSSPGPSRQHSSPPREAKPISRRPRSRKANLEIKVLYTLDSHPNSTLVAHLGRAAPVQIVSFGRRSEKRRSMVFGKVSLKTCLGAICMASPEIMIDRTQDYILYSIDPIESYRSSQRSANGAAPFASTSTLSTEASRHSPSRSDGTKQKDGKHSLSSFAVGKGFFSWALAEQGEGQSLVNGRVRDEYAEEGDADTSIDNDGIYNDDDLTGKVLEVSLRLKAATGISRDQYVDRVKALHNTSTAAIPPKSSTSETLQMPRNRRKGGERQPQSASSPVTAIEKEQSQAAVATNNNPAQQQLLHFLQALQAASGHSPQDMSSMADQSANLSTSMDQYRQQLKSGTSPDAMSNLLRTLAAPSPSARSSKSPGLGGSTALPGRAASSTPRPVPSKTPSRISQSAASPILGGLTPGYEVDYLGGPSPDTNAKATAPTEVTKVKMENEEIFASRIIRSSSSMRMKQCCYNCGIPSQRSWRHLTLPNEDSVRFKDGSIVWDHGKKLHRACNACGLYFNKYNGIDRPEHVWREAQRVKTDQNGKGNGSNGGEDDSAVEDGGGASVGPGRTKQIARTLSEVCERDSTRRESLGGGEEESDQDTTVGSAPPRRVANFDEARLKDLVQDREGTWRTKRSILENPGNKKPGRPKGSKTGQGQGRPRERRLRNKKLEKQQQEMMQYIEEEQMDMTNGLSASSPGESTKRATFDMSGIHSSPVRSSSSLGHQIAKTPGSAVSRVRYGAASYLLDSSPATAFQTVVNEAETDWKELCGLSPRRSPRKHPHGTLGGLNPYATVITSPSRAMMDTKVLPSGDLSAQDLLKMTSSSPLTRSRVKSGQYQFDESWFSSEGLDFGLNTDAEAKKTGSSSMTSPGSPSPSPAHLRKKGVKRKSGNETVMLQPGQRPAVKRGKLQGTNSVVSTEKARKAARQARQAASSMTGSDTNTAANNGAGPFMGLDLVDSINGQHVAVEEEEEEAGSGSPTLGRSRRMDRKRSANGDLGSLSMQASPTSAILDFHQDWTRSASMQELFPTPSPVKQWTNLNANSPSNVLWQSPTSWTVKGIAASPKKSANEQVDKEARTLLPIDTNQQRPQASAHQEAKEQSKELIRRKPLPATVEDASSSVNSATSTPREDDEEDDSLEEGTATNLMDLFEDPYGLLAASGIGGQGNQPGVSMEDFNSIELFKNVDFTQHLDFFTQMGSNGVAAHIAPDQGSSSSTLKLEGKGTHQENTADFAIDTSTTSIDFATLLKDPSMQALLAHMQQSPSKSKQGQITAANSSHSS